MKAVNWRPLIGHPESVMYRWGLRCFVADVLNASPQALSGGAGELGPGIAGVRGPNSPDGGCGHSKKCVYTAALGERDFNLAPLLPFP
jgi:hypothetical protein